MKSPLWEGRGAAGQRIGIGGPARADCGPYLPDRPNRVAAAALPGGLAVIDGVRPGQGLDVTIQKNGITEPKVKRTDRLGGVIRV